MSKNYNDEDLAAHKAHAIREVNAFIDDLIESNVSSDKGRADKFSFWLEDYINFLRFEKKFKPQSLKRYKKGEILKVHLGYNIGSEEGGLHYCVVVENKNSINSPVITVVPLTSVKPNTDLEHLHANQIYLGDELFGSLNLKIGLLTRHSTQRLNELRTIIESQRSYMNEDKIKEIDNEIMDLSKEVALINKTKVEISKMKKGSIALVNQITTISKIRIYDPKTIEDVLSGVKLSSEKLDVIDDAISKMFLKQK